MYRKLGPLYLIPRLKMLLQKQKSVVIYAEAVTGQVAVPAESLAYVSVVFPKPRLISNWRREPGV